MIAALAFALVVQSGQIVRVGQTVAPTPTLWIIGDSTVRNVEGEADADLWGWGDCLSSSFDNQKIRVLNRAAGGRSSRTFLTEGKWDALLAEVKPGDFLLMQFGHNDAGKLEVRGSLPGIGSETQTVVNWATKKPEVVHTFGWYLSRYIQDARAKSVTPIVCSFIPHCPLPKTTIDPNPLPATYRLWAQQVAARENTPYVDLYGQIWTDYAKMRPEQIKSTYFGKPDYTHTNHEGAEFNASKVAEGIKALPDCALKDYLRTK